MHHTPKDSYIKTIKLLTAGRPDLYDELVGAIPERDVIRDRAILAAIDPDEEIFATTSLYFDCECAEDFIHPAGSECAVCECDGTESPDSRLNEILDMQVSKGQQTIDLLNPQVRESIEFHSAGAFLARVWQERITNRR